jgi:hypothetical protein
MGLDLSTPYYLNLAPNVVLEIRWSVG